MALVELCGHEGVFVGLIGEVVVVDGYMGGEVAAVVGRPAEVRGEVPAVDLLTVFVADRLGGEAFHRGHRQIGRCSGAVAVIDGVTFVIDIFDKSLYLGCGMSHKRTDIDLERSLSLGKEAFGVGKLLVGGNSALTIVDYIFIYPAVACGQGEPYLTVVSPEHHGREIADRIDEAVGFVMVFSGGAIVEPRARHERHVGRHNLIAHIVGVRAEHHLIILTLRIIDIQKMVEIEITGIIVAPLVDAQAIVGAGGAPSLRACYVDKFERLGVSGIENHAGGSELIVDVVVFRRDDVGQAQHAVAVAVGEMRVVETER